MRYTRKTKIALYIRFILFVAVRSYRMKRFTRFEPFAVPFQFIRPATMRCTVPPILFIILDGMQSVAQMKSASRQGTLIMLSVLIFVQKSTFVCESIEGDIKVFCKWIISRISLLGKLFLSVVWYSDADVVAPFSLICYRTSDFYVLLLAFRMNFHFVSSFVHVYATYYILL